MRSLLRSLHKSVDLRTIGHRNLWNTRCSLTTTEPYHSLRILSRSLVTSQLTDLRRYILTNTEPSRDHLTPEISLHLVTPRCRLWRARQEEVEVPDPFWAFYWPGGQALTRYLLDNPALSRGRSVLDVGSGCGASAIAAAKCGAHRVVANDICPVAAVALEENATLNKVQIDITTDNLIGQPIDQWDVLLLGDMFYDEDFAQTVHDWLSKFHAKTLTILIGDPGRFAFTNNSIRTKLKEVAQYELMSNCKEENNGLTHGSVWKYVQS